MAKWARDNGVAVQQRRRSGQVATRCAALVQQVHRRAQRQRAELLVDQEVRRPAARFFAGDRRADADLEGQAQVHQREVQRHHRRVLHELMRGAGMADRGFIDPALAGLPQWQALAVAPLASAASSQAAARVRQPGVPRARALDAPSELTQRQLARGAVPRSAKSARWCMREVMPLYEIGRRPAPPHRRACGDGVRRVLRSDDDRRSRCPTARAGLMAIARRLERAAPCPSAAASAASRSSSRTRPTSCLRVDALTGRMLYVNRAVERLTGYAPEEFYRDAGAVRAPHPARAAARVGGVVLAAAGDRRRARSISR